MPSATNARALDPGRLTLTAFGSPPVGEIFPPGGRRHTAMEQHVPRPESHEPARVAHWSPRAEQKGM
ncbi:MAG: hypothetical protein LBQ54_11265 [Planctomycetaceae bacterium]|nr:hypothetical protein [Planctomycetaceae bacterium]